MKGLNVKNGRKNNASDMACAADYNASLLYKEKKTNQVYCFRDFFRISIPYYSEYIWV